MAVKKRATARKGLKKTAATKKRRTVKKAVSKTAHKGRKTAAPKRKAAAKRKTAPKKAVAKRSAHKKVARSKGRKGATAMRAHSRKKKKLHTNEEEVEGMSPMGHKKSAQHKKHHTKSSMMEYMQGFGGDVFGEKSSPKKGVRRGTKRTGARARRSKKR